MALAVLPGFGAWTAQYVALRALAEPDAFPASDLVLRRMAAGGGAPLNANALEARAEAWRPWRGYAALHLWSAAGQAVIPDRVERVRKRPVRAKRRAKVQSALDRIARHSRSRGRFAW